MPLDACRQALEESFSTVVATLPSGRTQALLALLRAGDAEQSLVRSGNAEEIPVGADDPAPAARPGWNLALQLCLERCGDANGNENGGGPNGEATLATWAERFLIDCDQLALAGLALAQCATGHLSLQQHAPGSFVAWATNRRRSLEQREGADFDWWSAQVARQAAPRLAALLAERPHMRALLSQGGLDDVPTGVTSGMMLDEPTAQAYYHQLGHAHVARFACQHSYPDGTSIGGATFGQYGAILALLIGWLYREHDRRAPGADATPGPWEEQTLIAALAMALDADPTNIGPALQHFVLDRDNAAYHGALSGRAAPPLIRVDAHRVVCSARGLLHEPLLFLARELRRRYAQEYHNSAHLREGVFRQDLYRLFEDRRFVRSTGPIELKRGGAARTDLDALVFDRETGTLGVFELKAQDPFARSSEERQRQRANFLQANRQVAAILEWVQRHGPDDLLARFDQRAAKRVHAQKVHVFVLGRYLAHVADGSATDQRAAWTSWPQVLQAVENGALNRDQRNPLGTLFARLRDTAPHAAPADAARQTIAVGSLRLRIYSSFAAMRAEEDRPLSPGRMVS